MPAPLELERDVGGRAAEQRHRDRIGQPHAQRPHAGRKQLGLHDGVDACVAANDHERGQDQQQRLGIALCPAKRIQDRHCEQRAEDAEPHQHRTPAYPVADGAKHGLHDHEQKQRDERDFGRPLPRELQGVGQVGRHVGAEGIECRRAAHRQAEHERHLPRLGHELLPQARPLRRGGGGPLPLGALGQVAAQVEAVQRTGGPDAERDAPGPCLEFRRREPLLHDEQHQRRQHLAADQRDVLERAPKPTVFCPRRLAQVGRGRRVFAAERQPLQDARGQQ